LESFEVLPLEECCEKESAGTHRCDSGCSVVEDGGIKTEIAKVSLVPPTVVTIVLDLARNSAPRFNPPEIGWPPFQIHHLPQFVIHTALPIRAPSFAS
jgi:hypothetical protein